MSQLWAATERPPEPVTLRDPGYPNYRLQRTWQHKEEVRVPEDIQEVLALMEEGLKGKEYQMDSRLDGMVTALLGAYTNNPTGTRFNPISTN